MIHDHHITSFCAPPDQCSASLSARTCRNLTIASLKYCTIAGEALNPSVYNAMAASDRHQTDGRLRSDRNHTHHSHHTRGLSRNPAPWARTGPVIRRRPAHLRRPLGQKTANRGKSWCAPATASPLGLFKEYYRDPKLTHEAWHDGIYHTGDVAWRDEDGYLLVYRPQGRCHQVVGLPHRPV